MDQVTVESLHRWGKLIKTWATGRSYFADEVPSIPIEKLPVPRSVDEVRSQAALVGAGLVVPQNVKGLAVVQYSPDTLVIRLPPKERIEAMEVKLKAGGSTTYSFPAFYEDFGGRNLSVDERMEVHACRIGDYTISMCG